MTKAADDYETIRRRMEELKAERDLALTGSSVPQVEEQKEQPSWNIGYGAYIEPPLPYVAPAGWVKNSAHDWTREFQEQAELKSLAHPSWPYAGTGFEWRKFVRS